MFEEFRRPLTVINKQFFIPNRLYAAWDGAGDEIRTHDPNHGKVVLYQLSYARVLPGYLATGLKVSE